LLAVGRGYLPVAVIGYCINGGLDESAGGLDAWPLPGGATAASMLCLVCWGCGGEGGREPGWVGAGCDPAVLLHRGPACCPHAVSTRIPRLTLPRLWAMLLVSGSALDRTCPGARRSLGPPEDGTSDDAGGVVAAAWTGLTWQATASL
jgi:hypothetical protein